MSGEDWLEVFMEGVGDGASVKVDDEGNVLAAKSLDPAILEAMEEYSSVDQQIKDLTKRKEELRETVESYGIGAAVLSSGRVIAVGERKSWDTSAKKVPALVKKLIALGKYELVAKMGIDTAKLKAVADRDSEVRALLTEKVTKTVTFKDRK